MKRRIPVPATDPRKCISAPHSPQQLVVYVPSAMSWVLILALPSALPASANRWDHASTHMPSTVRRAACLAGAACLQPAMGGLFAAPPAAQAVPCDLVFCGAYVDKGRGEIVDITLTSSADSARAAKFSRADIRITGTDGKTVSIPALVEGNKKILIDFTSLGGNDDVEGIFQRKPYERIYFVEDQGEWVKQAPVKHREQEDRELCRADTAACNQIDTYSF